MTGTLRRHSALCVAERGSLGASEAALRKGDELTKRPGGEWTTTLENRRWPWYLVEKLTKESLQRAGHEA